MDWLGAALGIAGDLFGQSSALDAQQAMMREQMAFNREVMQNRHQWEVGDLKAAGLNPLMSVTSPTGTLSAPTPASVPKLNLAQSAAALGSLKIQDKMADAALINAKANERNSVTQENLGNFEMGPQFDLKSSQAAATMDNLIADTKLKNQEAVRISIDNIWEPLLKQSQLNYQEQQVAALKLVSAAQAEYYHKAGDAALTSAYASVVNANANDFNAKTNRMLGEKEIELKDVNMTKVNAEVENILQDTYKKTRDNNYLKGLDSSSAFQFSHNFSLWWNDLPSIFPSIIKMP